MSLYSVVYKNGELMFESDKKFIDIPAHDEKIMVGDKVIWKEKERKICLVERKSIRLVGVIRFDIGYVYSLGKGKIAKLFESSIPGYPNMMASTRKTSYRIPYYAYVEYVDWKDDQKMPTCQIIDMIGPVGELEKENMMLKYKYGISKRLNDKAFLDMLDLPDPYHKFRKDIRHEYIVSIDPYGSLDIDDAFHFKKYDDTIELGIHIADVSSYIPESSELNDIIQNRGETVYLKSKKINMLPNIFADDICSLLPEKDRRAITVIFKWDKKINSFVFSNSYPSMIKSSHAYTYDNADDDKMVVDLISQLNIECTIDATHILIETIMKMTNMNIAKCIQIAFGDFGVYRIQLPSHGENLIRLEEIDKAIPQEIKKEILVSQKEGAKYVFGWNDIYEHYSLGIKEYTHFTSPIRRYVDIIVHRIWLYSLTTKNKPKVSETICDKLTQKQKEIRKYIHDVFVVDLVSMLDKNEFVTGYILQLRNYDVSILIPKYKIKIWFVMVNNKLKSITDISKCSTKIIISRKDNKKTMKLSLGQKVNGLLILRPFECRFNKKISFQFIEPKHIFDETEMECIVSE
jgi:exoribonuclease R